MAHVQSSPYPYDFIGQILITQEQIEQRVAELGAQITADYRDSDRLLLLGLLRGSVVFLTDLMRKINRPMTMDFMLVSSYRGAESSGFVRIDADHKINIHNWDVILVDDIIDTGYTIHTVRKLLLERQPRSLKICALLDKKARHKVDIQIDYLGFEIPDYFVVGYGLDIDEKGRNLPYIAAVDLEKYRALYGNGDQKEKVLPMKTKAPRKIGILTSGGDSPGINAAIRGIGKAIAGHFNLQLIGFHDGFSGMAHNLIMPLEGEALSGILTTGGTILGTNRDKPYSAEEDGQRVDYTEKILQVYHQHNLDGLICLGGGNTQESAYYLQQKGLNVITLPVTIDNDIPQTDMTVGLNTAMEIAAEAIDRLHSTAFSHHRIIIVEIMGRETGWLTLGAGIAGGADVILIPEIPYDIHKVAEAILERSRRGKRFSLVAVAEGAIAKETLQFFEHARQANRRLRSGEEAEEVEAGLQEIEKRSAGDTLHLANRLQEFTRLQTRVTILGYLQRGGAPSAFDRVLATQLGTACAHLVSQGHYGVMVGIQGGSVKPTPLAQVAGKVKRVPLDHSWVQGARLVGTCLGD